MARTPVRSRTTAPPSGQRARSRWSALEGRRKRRTLRFWYVPLLLSIALPLLLWAGANVALVIFATRDLGSIATEASATATPAADQPLLDAATNLVQTSACAPATSSIQTQPAYVGAAWTARHSEADSHAYYVAAADPTTQHLLGIWQVEGGQVLRLQGGSCLGLAAGTPERLAEAAVLFSPHRLGTSNGQ